MTEKEPRDELPKDLASEKSNAEQIAMCFKAYHDKDMPTLFD